MHHHVAVSDSLHTQSRCALLNQRHLLPNRVQMALPGLHGAFLIVASILLVAAGPAFNEDLTKQVHYGAALTLGLSATLWLILTTGVPYIAIAGAVIAILDRRHILFWVEAGLLYNLYASLIYILC